MNKSIILSLILGGAAVGAFAQSKMDAGAIMAADTYKALLSGVPASELNLSGMPFTAESVLSRADRPLSVFVILNDGASAADLESAGLEVATDLGKVVIARGTMEQIVALNDADFVKAISFGEERRPMMNRTRELTGADVIQAGGEGLSQAYNGTGVICGIFDTGLDPNHANFFNDNKESRVKALWNYTSYDGTNRAYLTPEAISRFTTDSRTETHGTHTLGIMTGSYTGNVGRVAIIDDATNKVTVSSAFKKINNPYYGMAPEADIAIGCGELYDPNIISGVKNIAAFAKEQGKPAVVNLSIGSNMGSHDGTDATSLALAELGKEVIIFMAAGNEGGDNISIDRVLGNPANFSTLIESKGNYSGYIEIWSDSKTNFSFIPIIQDLANGTTTEICEFKGTREGSEKLGNSSGSGNTFTNATFDKAFSSSSVTVASSYNTGTNGRYSARVNLNIRNNSVNNRDGNYVLGFKIVGTTGQHIQLVTNAESNGYPVTFTSMGLQGFVDGNADFTISSMACGENIICVGAYNGRKYWPIIGGGALYYTMDGYEVGYPAVYSSYGTLIDGRSLPDLVAPGTAVISSISTPYMSSVQSQLGEAFSTYVSNNISVEQTVSGRVNYWDAEMGTSMATPAVAGGVALWLQAKPDLTYDEIKEALLSTATTDALLPGSYPAAKVGAGKFSALNGLKKVLGLPLGVTDISANPDNNFFVTVENGLVEAYSATAGSLAATLVNLQGATVATAGAIGNTVTIATDALTPGVYILSVETPVGRYNRKVNVK